MKRTVRREIGRVIIFIVLLCALLGVTNRWFFADTPAARTVVDSFYAEEQQTLDVVYLGNSGVYRFYQPALAWEEYGFTSMTLATPSQPAAVVRYLIAESEKRQSPAVYVVDLRSFSDTSISDANMHNIFDFLPAGLNKLRGLLDCVVFECFWFADIPEYFFPVLRFHERWSELTADDLAPDISDTKGSYCTSAFLNKKQDEVEDILIVEESKKAALNSRWALNRLLNYADKQGVELFFVCSPLLKHEEQKKSINALAQTVKERGYPVLNFNSSEAIAAVGLSAQEHFMDNTHTNISGSILFTHYLAGVLAERYALPDHRTDEACTADDPADGIVNAADWNAAFVNYSMDIGAQNTAFFLELIGRAGDDRLTP